MTQFRKYGLQSELDNEEKEENDASSNEGDEIIREKLREHFIQINKMNETEFDQP